MRELIQKELITEVTGSQSIAYILREPELFSVTEYRVLKSQDSNRLIKCSMDEYNGKTKLIYRTRGYQSLSELRTQFDENRLKSAICELILAVFEVEENGFLHCGNLDISLDRMYMENESSSIGMVYLPLNGGIYDFASFEKELKTRIAELISGIQNIDLAEAKYILELLADKKLQLKEIYKILHEDVKGKNSNKSNAEAKPKNLHRTAAKNSRALFLYCTDNSGKFTLKMTGDEFVVGKNPSKVDGVISFNKAISRVHCKFVYDGGQYYIIDLGSANGTFINNKRISPQTRIAVKDGDSVRLANSNFIIEIQGVQ